MGTSEEEEEKQNTSNDLLGFGLAVVVRPERFAMLSPYTISLHPQNIKQLGSCLACLVLSGYCLFRLEEKNEKPAAGCGKKIGKGETEVVVSFFYCVLFCRVRASSIEHRRSCVVRDSEGAGPSRTYVPIGRGLHAARTAASSCETTRQGCRVSRLMGSLRHIKSRYVPPPPATLYVHE
ncbi:hypothetical protein ACLOJK_018269 [Asimina triloba]